jgi:hypothetical protein
MTTMKGHALKTGKSAVRKQRKSVTPDATVIRRTIKKSFAEQVDAFIE